jgi:hypothetical protein
MDFDPKQAATMLGRLGGLKKSERKAAACRANGKLARRKKPVPEPQHLTVAPVSAQPTPQPARPAAFLVIPK